MLFPALKCWAIFIASVSRTPEVATCPTGTKSRLAAVPNNLTLTGMAPDVLRFQGAEANLVTEHFSTAVH
jgi:hypothetical protein